MVDCWFVELAVFVIYILGFAASGLYFVLAGFWVTVCVTKQNIVWKETLTDLRQLFDQYHQHNCILTKAIEFLKHWSAALQWQKCKTVIENKNS